MTTNPNDEWRIPDALWAEVEPRLPPRKPHPLGCHNPRVPDRDAMDAILLVLRTGCAWRELERTCLCNHSSAYRRFREWLDAGVFHELLRLGLLDREELAGVDWGWLVLRDAPAAGDDGTPEEE